MSEPTNQWKPTAEAKGKATQFRLIAGLLWLVAIGMQAYTIFVELKKDPINMVLMIVLMTVVLALALTGSYLWKKANRLDPASEKDKVKFFIQNQLGAILGVLAFLPLVILIFTNKNLDGKTKGILGGIAALYMVIAGIGGADFAPPSIEKYTEETNMVEALTGQNVVYWTEHGGKYHLDADCHHIKNRGKIYSGTVAEAKASKGITDLCLTCKNRKMKQDNMSEESLQEKLEQLKQSLPTESSEGSEVETKEAA
jgi:uncharacterized protein with PQ loop repeat